VTCGFTGEIMLGSNNRSAKLLAFFFCFESNDDKIIQIKMYKREKRRKIPRAKYENGKFMGPRNETKDEERRKKIIYYFNL
jgi:hypothetical protein